MIIKKFAIICRKCEQDSICNVDFQLKTGVKKLTCFNCGTEEIINATVMSRLEAEKEILEDQLGRLNE